MNSRSQLVMAIFSTFVAIGNAQPSTTGLASNEATKTKSAIERGYEYLRLSIDEELNLLPEYRGASTYWLYHDNYLAAKVLRARHPSLAERIEKSIAAFGVGKSGKIEILYGATDGFPFREYQLALVKKLGDKSIKTERTTDQAFKGWRSYADLLFLSAIAHSQLERAADHDTAIADINAGYKLWDGIGFRDAVVANNERYATYKLALAIVAHDRTSQYQSMQRSIDTSLLQIMSTIERLLSLQHQDDGWITDYRKDGTPVGKANVETTCLVILALEALLPHATETADLANR